MHGRYIKHFKKCIPNNEKQIADSGTYTGDYGTYIGNNKNYIRKSRMLSKIISQSHPFVAFYRGRLHLLWPERMI